MNIRSIVLYPKFKQLRKIQSIRQKHDPLAMVTEPNITLVFPFDLEIRKKTFEKDITNLLEEFEAFNIKFSHISKEENGYLVLNIGEGKEQLIQIHQKLYSDKLKPFLSEIPFKPYIVLGKFNSKETLDRVYNELKGTNWEFKAFINKIYVDHIDEYNKNSIEFFVKL